MCPTSIRETYQRHAGRSITTGASWPCRVRAPYHHSERPTKPGAPYYTRGALLALGRPISSRGALPQLRRHGPAIAKAPIITTLLAKRVDSELFFFGEGGARLALGAPGQPCSPCQKRNPQPLRTTCRNEKPNRLIIINRSGVKSSHFRRFKRYKNVILK